MYLWITADGAKHAVVVGTENTACGLSISELAITQEPDATKCYLCQEEIQNRKKESPPEALY